ncbi:zinc finger CCCH domain-containing protein 48 [Daucus carota subsp. sativus]|uniref:C3H1-type domain-containing protein n=1 Tax=Daucus carota subsp. sativus TaxID=79200 RepID=A0A164ZYV4_DAUCS|nr:PREDICTED: zinc finger CCCH domain-containing protein 48-like [Daucus carota subsp. sativus]
MEIKAATRVPGKSLVFDRVKVGGGAAKNGVCKYWMAGCCSRSDCRFLHPKIQVPGSKKSWKNPNYHVPKTVQMIEQKDVSRRHGSESQVQSVKKPFLVGQSAQTSEVKDVTKRPNKEPKKQLCKYWVTGDCVYGDKCKNLHSWYYGDGFTMLAKLEGHTKAVTGITLPSSDKLYSVSKDKSMRVWNCHTGQCCEVVHFNDECGSLMCDGPCIFVGLPNAVKAWNLEFQAEVALNGPVVGQVYAMEVGNSMFFAGTQDGNINVWKTGSSEVATTLKGHTGAVLSLIVGANRLYSGSMDKTIKVWDLDTLKCLQTLHGHSDVVMSLLCWENVLLSGSLDGQIKVWAANESGSLEVVHESDEGHGILGFCGITDAEAKPILLCSCNDNSVRLYELPSFTERGRIYAKAEVRTVQIGTGGLFFTGDATGQLTVWKLNEKSSADVSS